MSKVLLVDNYDSFTYNLAHYIDGVGASVDVVFNDQIIFEKLNDYSAIVLSPGPGLPYEAGQLMKLIKHSYNTHPLLGVCLGFQALIEFFGGTLYNQQCVKHGIQEEILTTSDARLFKDTHNPLTVGLYHSWAAKEDTFPKSLKITGRSKSDTIMAFEHVKLPIAGVQFHPESILSSHGKKIVENFIFSFV